MWVGLAFGIRKREKDVSGTGFGPRTFTQLHTLCVLNLRGRLSVIGAIADLHSDVVPDQGYPFFSVIHTT